MRQPAADFHRFASRLFLHRQRLVGFFFSHFFSHVLLHVHPFLCTGGFVNVCGPTHGNTAHWNKYKNKKLTNVWQPPSIQIMHRAHTESALMGRSSFRWRVGWSCCWAQSPSFQAASGEESARWPAAVTSACLETTAPAWSSGGSGRSRARPTTALMNAGSG